MAKILLVHGMRQQGFEPDELHDAWVPKLVAKLAASPVLAGRTNLIPDPKDVGLAFWADLFAWPDLNKAMGKMSKGVDLATIRQGYYAFLRGVVNLADMLGAHDADGRADSLVAHFVDELVAQSAVYMHNGPVYHPDPAEGDGAYYQVQARFRKELHEDTTVVIGHSLGSVVAYEGLCSQAHRVKAFITVGSPIATPDLILNPLRKRQSYFLGTDREGSPPWPGTKTWTNVCSDADVWCAPRPRLAPVFGKRVTDLMVQHGSPHKPQETHDFRAYLEDDALITVIAQALIDAE